MSSPRLLTIVLTRFRHRLDRARRHWSALPGQQNAGRSGYYPIIGGGRQVKQGRRQRIKSGKGDPVCSQSIQTLILSLRGAAKAPGAGPWTASGVRARNGMSSSEAKVLPTIFPFPLLFARDDSAHDGNANRKGDLTTLDGKYPPLEHTVWRRRYQRKALPRTGSNATRAPRVDAETHSSTIPSPTFYFEAPNSTFAKKTKVQYLSIRFNISATIPNKSTHQIEENFGGNGLNSSSLVREFRLVFLLRAVASPPPSRTTWGHALKEPGITHNAEKEGRCPQVQLSDPKNIAIRNYFFRHWPNSVCNGIGGDKGEIFAACRARVENISIAEETRVGIRIRVRRGGMRVFIEDWPIVHPDLISIVLAIHWQPPSAPFVV
ncbi:hypothetical protein SCHPADRAFT_893898 [Schizopora paradoxa]|uniref:Uncharacterized protein n=1 Tax=Schizopora paradoxa TaxID=27342 RepID=A0A0H2R9D1_9AGAM|nr:hypothetical protein SCHPADRAFT_893898 [Schizopora paradoxa]